MHCDSIYGDYFPDKERRAGLVILAVVISIYNGDLIIYALFTYRPLTLTNLGCPNKDVEYN